MQNLESLVKTLEMIEGIGVNTYLRTIASLVLVVVVVLLVVVAATAAEENPNSRNAPLYDLL